MTVRRFPPALLAAVVLACLLPISAVGQSGNIKHVLLISVDGMHALDVANYVAKNPQSALAELAGHGLERFRHLLSLDLGFLSCLRNKVALVYLLDQTRTPHTESLSPMRARLDATDWRILKELQANGRITNVELARKVGISPPPCLRSFAPPMAKPASSIPSTI